jgi:signal transduction histidine kinase/CheY-like chemotaxis protein
MMNTDQSTVLEYIIRLAEQKEPPPLETVLQQLADYFDSTGIGVSCLESHSPELAWFRPGSPVVAKFPWHTEPSLMEQLRAGLPAVTQPDESGEWLTALAWEPRQGDALFVWLVRRRDRGWSAEEAAIWPLVGQALVRWLVQNHGEVLSRAQMCQKLEHAALVTSRLSHDFGNYLTGILGFTELSLPQVPRESQLHRYLLEVLQSARDGSDWIKRLHWFCRRNGHYSWPTELSSVLDEAQLRAAAGPQPRWVKKIPADLPLLAIDTASLSTALRELANNVREAARGPCTLTWSARPIELTDSDCRSLVGTAQAGKYVEISASDDGPGIAPEVRDRLFRETFFSTKPRHRGLGLLVVYGILHRFHGGVAVGHANGGPPSQGGCVRMYVPVAAVETIAAAGKQAPHVLVVHPDPLLFESLRKILEWQGCRVSVALTAQAALGMYQAQGESFALVLADALLPQLSGFDLARRILDRDSKARFLFLYTQASFHGLAEEEMLKRFTLLRWPLETADFVRAVRSALAHDLSPSE